MTNVLKKKLKFYLDFEILGLLTIFGFSRGAYRGVAEVKIRKNYNFLTSDSCDHILRGSRLKVGSNIPPNSMSVCRECTINPQLNAQ